MRTPVVLRFLKKRNMPMHWTGSIVNCLNIPTMAMRMSMSRFSVMEIKNTEKPCLQLIELLKHLPKKDKEWYSVALALRAKLYTVLQDTTKKAIADLAQAIKIEPTNPKYYNARAELNYELKNYALADADYQKMISLDQGNVMGYMGIGRNANAESRWDDAIDQFNHVIKLAPDYSLGYSFRADSYIGKNMWAEATDDIVKALDIDCDNKAFYLMQKPTQGGICFIKNQN